MELRRNLVRMDTLLAEMGTAEQAADRNAACVQASPWAARAGIFEKAPSQENAVATTLGVRVPYNSNPPPPLPMTLIPVGVQARRGNR